MVSIPEYAAAAPAVATSTNHEHNKNLNLYNGEWVKVSVPDFAAAAAAPEKAGLDSVHTAEVSWTFPVRNKYPTGNTVVDTRTPPSRTQGP